MGVSHSHSFNVFPSRMPRKTFSEDMMEEIREMAMKKTPTEEIKMRVGAVCNGDVFQNALRGVRKDICSEQCRALRNAACGSGLWSSEIHLTRDNVFVEAFFTNTALSPSCIDNDIVFIDDTSCANVFSLPLVSVLCRDHAQRVHSIAWGLVQNRTTATFGRFLRYVKNVFPSIQTFVCDRHFGQRKAIREVFGNGVSIFHCCVHIARNIRCNCGPNTDIQSRFLETAFQRVKGRQTTSTSAKVDHVSVPSQSKAVDDFQINTLQRTKKPTSRTRKRHACPVCRRDGHHARTCHDVLLDENAERADAFFERLIETGRVDSYVASLAKRERHNFVELVIGRINLLSEAARSPDGPARTDRTPRKVIE